MDYSFAYAINARGQVAGVGRNAAGQRAVLWSPDAPNGTTRSRVMMSDSIGETDVMSFASGINDNGQVVAYGQRTARQSIQAFYGHGIQPMARPARLVLSHWEGGHPLVMRSTMQVRSVAYGPRNRALFIHFCRHPAGAEIMSRRLSAICLAQMTTATPAP